MIKQVSHRFQSRFFLLVTLLLCCLLGGFLYTGKAHAAVSEDEHVYDLYSLSDIGLLTDEQEAELEALATKYSKEREINFVILTASYDSGMYSGSGDPIYYDTRDRSEQFYESLVEYDENYTDTVILTINIMDPNNSDFRCADIFSRGDGENKLDSNRRQTLMNKILSDLSDGNYYTACKKFLDLAYKYVNVATFMNPDSIFLKLWFQLVLAFGISFIIILVLISHSRGKMTVTGDSYMDDANSRVLGRYDRYIRTTTTKTKISSSSSGGGHGGGGGGGGHTTSHF